MQILLLLIVLTTPALPLNGQNLKANTDYYIAAIGFWNTENLYDTLNDQWKNDEDFTPVGIYAWNGEKYRRKIERLSYALSQIALDASPDGLALFGLCEVENVRVVEDLIASPHLSKRQYRVIHIEGPDARGVDPSFVYNPKYFKPLRSVSYPVHLPAEAGHFTRDILVVSGTFLGEAMAILVNHWPSRRGGELVSRPNRMAAAKVAKHICDSIQKADSSMKLVLMGDFNDDPIDQSIKVALGTFGDSKQVQSNSFYNPMETLFREGIGSLAWQDSWNLFDQILLSKNWLSGNYLTWHYYAVRVFNKTFLRSENPGDKGYPLRTFSGATYTGGYSDHFPVFVLLTKEKKK